MVKIGKDVPLWVATSTFVLLLLVPHPTPTWAWGSLGHRWINRLAIGQLPQALPSFLTTPEAVAEIERLGPEPDRLRGAGTSADADENPGHFVDAQDDGTVGGIVHLDALPATREAYDSALRSAGTNQFKMGFLPYSLIDGWERIRKDFAWWRVDSVGEGSAPTAEDRAWFAADRRLREQLIIRDIGVWGHYVGDASQPLHTSIHFNGWGALPNKEGYSTSTTLHERFEGAYVRDHVREEVVRAAMPPSAPCDCPVEQQVGKYLGASWAQVIPLYELEKGNALERATPEATAFVVARLAAGAAAMRDLIVDAWRGSAKERVGYPPVSVSEVEAGKVILTRSLFEQ